MFSADIPLFFLRVLLIKLLLLGCCFPKCHEMIVFAVFVFPYFKNERVQLLSHPANRPILLWHVGALVKVVGLLKDLLHLDPDEVKVIPFPPPPVPERPWNSSRTRVHRNAVTY